MPCILIRMITNSISCLDCLDASGVFYIVYIVCIFASTSYFAEECSNCGCLSAVLIVNIPMGDI